MITPIKIKKITQIKPKYKNRCNQNFICVIKRKK